MWLIHTQQEINKITLPLSISWSDHSAPTSGPSFFPMLPPPSPIPNKLKPTKLAVVIKRTFSFCTRWLHLPTTHPLTLSQGHKQTDIHTWYPRAMLPTSVRKNASVYIVATAKTRPESWCQSEGWRKEFGVDKHKNPLSTASSGITLYGSPFEVICNQ